VSHGSDAMEHSTLATTDDGRALCLMTHSDADCRSTSEQCFKSVVRALQASEVRYRTLLQASMDCVVVCRQSDGHFIEVNHVFLELLGYEPHEVVGRTAVECGFWATPDLLRDLAEMFTGKSRLRDFKTQLKRKNGEHLWVMMSAASMELHGEACVMCVMKDVSTAKAAEDEIRNLAFYDSLTQLPNRRLLLDLLRQNPGARKRDQSMKALLFIDLDNFKTLNDTLGYKTGDVLLQEVAVRLSACIRSTDTVARLGGDEFVVMIEDLSESPEEAAAQAAAIAEKILIAIDAPYQLPGHEWRGSCSIGITIFGDRRDNAEEVLQQADIANYQAKSNGRNTVHFFAPALQAAVHERVLLEDDLRKAIGTDQFLLEFQPQVNCGSVIGAEALIRWKHPKRGTVLPCDFIPLAEETGLILPLGNWVVQNVCMLIASLAARGEATDITFAVNISARQFRQPKFVEEVLSALDRSGASPKSLKLELTESMLVDDFEKVISKMTDLKSHGLTFSLDDFGTGYSSLSYLKRLPLDELKIDRSFVRDILVDACSGEIAHSIISLGRAMGLSVIAEGVETEAQREFLARLGCHSFQGYLFSRPLPLEKFWHLLRGIAKGHAGISP